ncbi:unnamed protein product [Acanthoscelides obtectus]|uniref:ascorbate ferrireductase (transmembrane) n=1 Tax=Acanthoscelides obtectus TaxID=200917 RepID=A0A9P0LDS9_ACAOB|nr:unnamed protein product [Acanthoscelides obtectus]CAK1641806.1 hypothetical protein AOBTE_LOCUS12645 [Acanthoscelides obtectus]
MEIKGNDVTANSASLQESVSLCNRVSTIANLLLHQLIAVVTGLVLWVLFAHLNINQYILWHAVLLVMAFLPLMSGGILCFSSNNVWLQGINRSTRYYIHGIFLTGAVISMTVGISLEIYSRCQSGKLHFQTSHSITGLVSWISAFISCLLGLASFYSRRLKNIVKPVHLKLLHSLFALASFSIGIASLCLGFEKKSYALHVTETQLSASQWMVIIIAVFIGLSTLRDIVRHVKAICR